MRRHANCGLALWLNHDNDLTLFGSWARHHKSTKPPVFHSDVQLQSMIFSFRMPSASGQHRDTSHKTLVHRGVSAFPPTVSPLPWAAHVWQMLDAMHCNRRSTSVKISQSNSPQMPKFKTFQKKAAKLCANSVSRYSVWIYTIIAFTSFPTRCNCCRNRIQSDGLLWHE